MSISYQQAKERFCSKFSSLDLLEFYGMRKPIKISCPLHGEVVATSFHSSIHSKHGCPKCAEVSRQTSGGVNVYDHERSEHLRFPTIRTAAINLGVTPSTISRYMQGGKYFGKLIEGRYEILEPADTI